MAIVELNKKNISKLKIKDIDDRLSMLGCPVEEETSLKILVDISPNRPDLLSEQGVIRALETFIGKRKGIKSYKAEKSGYAVKIESSVKDVRPYTACAVVKNLKLDDEKIEEIIEIQEKLHTTLGRNRKKIAIGIYPLEKIKFPVIYKALKPEEIKFQPLEADREMTAMQILQQHPTGKEYASLLEGKNKFPVFADASGSIMSMPPIINSNTTGKITGKTTDAFIECSGFDFNTLSKCLNIIVCALEDMGGKIYSVGISDGNKKEVTPNLSNEKINININNVNKLLGLDLKEADMKKLLEKMGFSYSNKTAEIPPYRTDILHEVDIIEDIAIAYGYENFKEEIPQISTIGKEDNFEVFKRNVAEILVGLGMLETYSYNLINEEEENNNMETSFDLVRISNTKTNYNALRASMVPSLIKILSENKDKEYPQNIFETGAVNIKKDNDIESYERTGIVSSPGNFTFMKQILDALAISLGIKYDIAEAEHPSYINGRTGRIIINNRKVGYIGEISPKVLENWNLKMPAAAIEINLTELFDVIK